MAETDREIVDAIISFLSGKSVRDAQRILDVASSDLRIFSTITPDRSVDSKD